MKRLITTLLLALTLAAGALALPSVAPAQAQIDSGLTAVGETVKLPGTDPRVIATRIINVALGLIAIVLVMIILYAGFLYMTAGGDAEKVQTAITWLRNAIIGLILILMSWGIARFVIERVLSATGGGGGGGTTTPGGGGPGGGGGLGGGGGTQPFAIVSITPNGNVPTRKVIVKILFNRNVSAASAQAAITAESNGTAIPGEVTVDGAVARFTPTQPCPAPNDARRCFPENADIQIHVASTIESESGQAIACGGFSPSCDGAFRTGSAVDVTPPAVSITYPVDGQSVPGNAIVDVNASIQDETGVAYISVSQAPQGQPGSATEVGQDAPNGSTPSSFNGRVGWDTAGLAPGSRHVLTATGFDADSGTATSRPVTVTIRSDQCFNGVQDAGETGIDCGGDPAAATFCGACSGQVCTQGSECASGVCVNNRCVEQPIITSVSPLDAAPGSYVTVRGVNFGTSGQVTFLGAAGSAGVVARSPQACSAAGIQTWSPMEVMVEVPAGAQNGPLRLLNSGSGLADATNALPDPAIADFLVTNTARPGICAAVPNNGAPGQSFRLVGTGFGNTASSILFGDRTLASSRWTDAEVQALIPNIAEGPYPVTIAVGGRSSNPVDVIVTPLASAGGPPQITSVDPASGAIGSMVTIAGRNFGNAVGQVYFRNVASGNEALADTNFPPACSQTFWSDTAVIVKVPPSFTRGGSGALATGAYAVRVVSANAAAGASNEANFAVNTQPVAPGICAVTPAVGPPGTPVTIAGERFSAGPGTVTFFRNQNGTATPWTDTQVSSVIPAGAQTGALTVTPSGNGLTSNGFPVRIQNCNEAPNICGGGSICCADGTCRASGACAAGAEKAMFAWRVSTGLIPRAPRVIEECRAGELPSPSPWLNRSGGDAACVNATITIRFSTQLEPASIGAAANSIRLFACTGTGSDPCTTRTPASLASGSPRLAAANATQDYVMLETASPLQTATTYEVVLTTAIRGLGEAGTNMDEDASRCGEGNAYCFRFRTRADATPCTLGSVQVTPDPYTASEQGPISSPYAAVPFAQGDSCTVLRCESYDWRWSASDGRASVTNNLDASRVPAAGACLQTVTAQLETGDDPVVIQAATAGVTGGADLFVRFVPPRVERFGPDCDEACINAAVWAVLTTELDPASVRASNVTIERCANENCLELDAPLPLSDADVQLVPAAGSSDARLRQINILPLGGGNASLLLPGRFYKVTIRGGLQDGIRSLTQVPLTGLNDPEGFSWTFRVKPGDAGLCQVERIDVVPTEKYETRVGARQGFVATPVSAPDTCSEQGQQLVAVGGFGWASSRPTVATLLENGGIDTGAPLPNGCSGRCTFLGSSGRSGQTARCGNSRVETTNAAYCVGGRTPSGAACDLLPAGGRGGEECDDGNTNANDACSDTCLWNPVASVAQGGSCGNGIVTAGEDCDPGRVCMGAGATSTTPNGSDCTSAVEEGQCLANGGTCAPAMIRGCSPTCRNLGSSAGSSTCGNGDVANGEDCDDGNSASGDGCSANCLNEGSSRLIYALCGNGVMEAGEACERQGASGVWPVPGCNPASCLRTGVQPCTASGQTLCCGNANPNETGKDCDDGNAVPGDGCSAICLAEGSSLEYATPSFCSNGVLEAGEQCESPGPAFAGDPTNALPGGDGATDPFQIATIVGEDAPDAEGKMSSNITAQLADQNKTGTAIYGLQCGFSDERQCSPDRVSISAETGLTTNGCCDARPRLESAFPPNGAGDTIAGRASASDPFPEGVCRNALISGRFNVDMEEPSLQGNFIVAKRVAGDVCPQGMTDVTQATPARGGFRGFVQRFWHRVTAFFRVPSATAARWCAGTVTGRLTAKASTGGPTEFFYTLDTALEARTEYRVRFLGDTSRLDDPLGDNNVATNRKGIKSKTGVVAPPDTGDEGALTWHFTTGDHLCTVDAVQVRDLTLAHPYFFMQSGERHPFVGYAQSVVNGRAVPLSPTQNYAWEWQPWVFSNPSVIAVDPLAIPVDQRTGSAVSTEAVAQNVSGAGYLSARVRVTADTINTPSTQDRIVQGTAQLTVNVCENPWPSRETGAFRDERGSPDLVGTPFAAGPFYNFAVNYCRDAGVTGPNGDLPALVANAAPVNSVDASQGILRQYLFTFREGNLQKDGIGIRIASNPLHLSPSEWYRSKGFTGNPEKLTVDGYEAVRDGRTVYVSAVNTEGPDATGASSDLYSNIYLISYNEGAEPITQEIMGLLLKSMSFNTNIQFDVANACQTTAGGLQTGSDGLPVTCSADWECDKLGEGMRCANFKGKLQRDLVRLGILQSTARQLDTAKLTNGVYPSLGSGSYLPGLTTSRWPSWKAAFQSALGQNATVLEDPVNRFSTCGRCGGSGTACVADTDCGGGDTCVAQQGFDPATCWNTETKQFFCPADGQGSRFIQYRAIQGGGRFELGTNLEVPPPNETNLADRWWKPAPFTQVNQCNTTTPTRGNYCTTDADCRFCPAGNCTNVATPSGSCQPAGGSFRYVDMCQGGATLGTTGVCGDGILDVDPTHTRCLGGTRDGAVCTSAADCAGGGSCVQAETCETTGPTATQQAACTTSDNQSGQQQMRCVECRRYVPDDRQPGCFPVTACGNGRVDAGEACDNGVANGTYGRCNSTCTGYDAFCGDGQLSLGERCDLGANNGTYCGNGASCSDVSQSCSLTCNGPGPFCGDGHVDVSEQCDGPPLRTAKAICTSGTNRDMPCTSAADCGTGGTCGGTGADACRPGGACVGLPGACASGASAGQACTRDTDCGVGIACVPSGQRIACTTDADCGAAGATCALGVPYERVRNCADPETAAASGAAACQWSAWSACGPASACGNGVAEAGEQCDDGNTINEDGCTTSCRRNVCGDSFLFRNVEECDNGATNGTPCANAEYGATCTSCSTSCKFQLTQGGYCGDNIRSPGSSEQCDGTDIPAGATCQSLGYDYLDPTSATLQCNASCQFTGCGTCGSRPGAGMVEGILLDTLFQQPVPNARVAVFSRGLQVNAVSTDATGYFIITGLDTTSGCNQYNLVVDSYTDNALTSNFNEATRGGYMPVSIGPFAPTNAALVTAAVGAGKGQGVTRPGSTGQILQVNMIPRLGDNEYVVQLWWDPAVAVNGTWQVGYAAVQDAFRAAADKAAFYTAANSEFHDLVVRVPQAFTPGSFASCSRNPAPVAYSGVGRNNTVDASGNVIAGGSPGLTGADRTESVNGMSVCTNKIRAGTARSCVGGGASNGTYGCVTDGDCQSPQWHNLPGATCTGGPELSRSGSPQVLQGARGAYLFCYHPEWPDGAPERSQSSCTSFLLPPQSVFISGNGGQYDILVSQFQLMTDGHIPGANGQNAVMIRRWLYDRNAEMRVFDTNGLFKRYNFRLMQDQSGSSGVNVAAGWSAYDNRSAFCLSPANRSPSPPWPQLDRLNAGSVSPVWTPLSIDTTGRIVREWNGGYAGADYKYFADILHYQSGNMSWPGQGVCWETTCPAVRFTQGSVPRFPVGPADNDHINICNGPGYSGSETAPACTDASRAACPSTYVCSVTVGGAPCVRVCTTDAECGANAFCGTPDGSCSVNTSAPVGR